MFPGQGYSVGTADTWARNKEKLGKFKTTKFFLHYTGTHGFFGLCILQRFGDGFLFSFLTVLPGEHVGSALARREV